MIKTFSKYIYICMMTSSNGNIFRVIGHLCGVFTCPGEFPSQRPVTRSFDVFFDLRPNKRLSKHWWGWWFETPSSPLWRHCNGLMKPATLQPKKMQLGSRPLTYPMIVFCLFDDSSFQPWQHSTHTAQYWLVQWSLCKYLLMYWCSWGNRASTTLLPTVLGQYQGVVSVLQ